MRLSKIKTKEIRYVVWKYRLKRFLPHILTLCLAVIVAGGAFSAYSVYHKKHQKQLAKQSEVQREKDVNTARKKAQKEKTTLKPWYTYHSIAHAMGGLDGKDYLNSIDGFYPAYQKGYRVFEMDILLTKDNVAIGKHQWGWKLSDPTGKKGDPVSYRKFKNTKIYGKYTPTSFLDVLNLMEKYPDFYLMTDSKSTEPADAKKEFNVLVQTAKKVGKEDLLDRVIVQVYNQRMYWAVKSVHPFKHFVYTTYKQPDAAFYKVVKFCKQNGIEAITSPKNDINDYRMELLAKQGILYTRRGQYGTVVTNNSNENSLYHYEKIELKIRHYIAENCNIGSRLPSILTFAEQYEVSAKTVKKALDNLSEEGYITFTRGRYGGTFVTDIPQGVNEAYKWLALSPEYATNIEKLEN